MAEIAIPAIALGAMYILSNQGETSENKAKTDTKENFENVSARYQRELHPGNVESGVPTRPPVNYPVQTYGQLEHNPAFYPAPNAATDRYYRQEVYEKEVEDGGNPSNGSVFKSLTGNEVQKADIKFNNMVPFFGSTVTQRTTGFNGNESLLDNMNGSGSTRIKKKAQAPLFKPQKDMDWAHGTPIHTDFIQSRMNPAASMNNTKPWNEIRVGPGLNKGFAWKGNAGFNAGMQARGEWLPYSVDQLRVKTNPKVTFGLGNHEGPANSIIKSRGYEGRVEKNRPDTFYKNTPDRWFTTTGQETAQRARSEEPLQQVNRPFTTRERFGAGTANQGGRSAGEHIYPGFNVAKRPQLAPYGKYMGGAHNLKYSAGWTNLNQNYGRSGYKSYPNARNTTKKAVEPGVVSRGLWAVVAPVMDMLRPSRKENVVGNLRPAGNVDGQYGVDQCPVWNPADRTRVTIREQTENNMFEAQPRYPHEGGYATADYQLREQQRSTTSCTAIGNATPGHLVQEIPVYNAAYNAHLNPNKEAENRLNHGSEGLFNGNQNIKSSKIGSGRASDGFANLPKTSGSISTYGEMGGKNTRGASIECLRTEPCILNAFNSNPYTKPLTSIAGY